MIAEACQYLVSRVANSNGFRRRGVMACLAIAPQVSESYACFGAVMTPL